MWWCFSMKKKQYVRTVIEKQERIPICGIHALCSLINFVGGNVTVDIILNSIDSEVYHGSAKELTIIADKMGYKLIGYKASFSTVVRIMMPPLMLFWEKNHYVVYEGQRDNLYAINDSILGRRFLNYDDMHNGYSGYVFEIRKG